MGCLTELTCVSAGDTMGKDGTDDLREVEPWEPDCWDDGTASLAAWNEGRQINQFICCKTF